MSVGMIRVKAHSIYNGETEIYLLIKHNSTLYLFLSTYRNLVNICGMNKLTNGLATELIFVMGRTDMAH